MTDTDANNTIYQVIMPLKLLLHKICDPDQFALFKHLMDHKETRPEFAEYWKGIKAEVSDCILDLKLDGIKEDDVFSMVGIIDTNAHEINCRSGCDYKGLFPLGALLSHNCVINTRQIMRKQAPFRNICR